MGDVFDGLGAHVHFHSPMAFRQDSLSRFKNAHPTSPTKRKAATAYRMTAIRWTWNVVLTPQIPVLLRGEHTSAHGPRRPNVRPKCRDLRDGAPGQHRHNSVAHSISCRRSPRRGGNSLAPVTLVPGGSNRVIGIPVLQNAKARPSAGHHFRRLRGGSGRQPVCVFVWRCQ